MCMCVCESIRVYGAVEVFVYIGLCERVWRFVYDCVPGSVRGCVTVCVCVCLCVCDYVYLYCVCMFICLSMRK